MVYKAFTIKQTELSIIEYGLKTKGYKTVDHKYLKNEMRACFLQ